MLEEVAEELKKRGAIAAVVFGSFAQDSEIFGDIDIFVVSNKKIDENALEEELRKKFRKVFDIFVLSPAEVLEILRKSPEKLANILNGKVLFGRKYIENYRRILKNALRGGMIITKREVIVWKR